MFEWSLLLPKVGDLIQAVVAWRKARGDSEEQIHEMLNRISRELDALAEQWIAIASELQRDSEADPRRLTEGLWRQRSHYGALRTFGEFLGTSELGNNHEFAHMKALIEDALSEKNQMFGLVHEIVFPGVPMMEAPTVPNAFSRERMRETVAMRASASLEDQNLSEADKILARRARWSKKGLELEFKEEEEKEKKIEEAARKTIFEATAKLSGLAGEFRIEVALSRVR
jgi:hypothetical protein